MLLCETQGCGRGAPTRPRRGGGGAAGTGEARQALPAGKGSPAGVVRGEEAWGAARPPQAGKRPEAASAARSAAGAAPLSPALPGVGLKREAPTPEGGSEKGGGQCCLGGVLRR